MTDAKPFISVILLVITSDTGQSGFGVDYCAMNCGNKKHLLCKFERQSAIGGCSNIYGKITPEERGHMLGLHNLFRNEFAMENDFYQNGETEIMNGDVQTIIAWNQTEFHRGQPIPFLQGFGYAECMRQLSWDYGNERAAQIYAEQCTEQPYDCITDFKEDFPQYMSIYTVEGTIDGIDAMEEAFDHWRATNLTMQSHPFPNPQRATWYYENMLADFYYDEETTFTPWANMAYWRTFLIGCGKAHFLENGTKWTRIVCIYGPGINYIAELKGKPGEPFGGVLYRIGTQCYSGEELTRQNLPSCPFFKCYCRAMKNYAVDPFYDYNSSWPWLCANDCQAEDRRPMPVPDLIDYMNRASSQLASPIIFVFSFFDVITNYAHHLINN